jgi:hypothetical protein
MSQLTLDFQPALPERFPTLREYIAHRATVVAKMPKVQAADMAEASLVAHFRSTVRTGPPKE